MSIDHFLFVATTVEAAECGSWLVSQLDMQAQRPDHVSPLVSPGLTVSVQPSRQDEFFRQGYLDNFGFIPSLTVSCRAVLSGANFDAAHRQMGAVLGCVLHNTTGSAALMKDMDRLLLLRTDGRLSARTDITGYLQPETLSALGMPYELRPLEP